MSFPISVTIQGATHDEFVANLAKFGRPYGLRSETEISSAKKEGPQTPVEKPSVEKAAKGTKERAGAKSEPEAAKPAQKKLVVDDVVRAIKAVVDTNGLGMERARAILTKFGAAKVTDISSDKFAEVIADAEAAVAETDERKA